MTQDGCLYAVSGYENDCRAECVLRYVPTPDGDRTAPSGTRYKKYDFADAFAWVKEHKPEYLDLVHRVLLADIVRVLKPEEEAAGIAARNPRVARLFSHFDLPPMSYGCTGSLVAGLENFASDIDMVVYGPERGDVAEGFFEIWSSVVHGFSSPIPFPRRSIYAFAVHRLCRRSM